MRTVVLGFRTDDPYSVLLANALAELCDVTLMLPEQAEIIKGVNTAKVNLQPFILPRYRQLSNILMLWDLLKRINHLNPNIVHTADWHPWFTLLVPKFLKAPWVSTVHDVSQHPDELGWQAIPAFLYPLQWHNADQIIVHATSAQKQLLTRHRCLPERVHVIPIGSFNFYHQWADKKLPEQPNTILFFGRIWGYKGLRYLIEAEPLISREIPDVRIIIAGTGEGMEKYEAMMVNRHHFEIHNYHIPDEQVAHFFQQASVVALPYIEASQSGVVSVAYAFGKPVVATRVGGIPDVVLDGETGLLAPPADAESLAKAIITLLKDSPLRSKMGQQAQQFAQTQLSWDGIAQKTLDVYQAQQRGDGL
jgi:glycosyltransferase involved in cell wall biosynthesis